MHALLSLSPPYLVGERHQILSLAMCWPQYWPLSLLIFPFVDSLWLDRFVFDNFSKVTLLSWPGLGYGRHWLFFRTLSSIWFLSIVGCYIVFKVIGSLYCKPLNYWLVESLLYIYVSCGFHRELLCNGITLFSHPHASAWWAPLNSFICEFGGNR